MIQIENTLISLDVIEKKFTCDLHQCKGICCVEGDAGAPLENDELLILEEIYPIVKPYLTQKGIDVINKEGYYVIDEEGDYVTPIIEGKECVYVYFEDNIAKCAIEKAYLDKKIDFKKPISCHLYPIRTTKYTEFEAVNYDVQPNCKPACVLGEKLDKPVYVFLKDVLIRKYGAPWYKQLEVAAKLHLENNNKSNN